MPIDIPLQLSRLEELANEHDTPYYLYDGNGIMLNALDYMETFKLYFNNFRQYFAVKALPNPSILEILRRCDMGFDCSSPEEIKIIQFSKSWIDKNDQIMYTSNYTSTSDLKWVLENYSDNIIINLDSIDGFYNILATKKNLPNTICFRYNPILNCNKNDIESNNFSGNNTKFGMTKKYLFEAYLFAKKHNIKHYGIHVMSQSNCMDIDYWKNLIDDVFEVINELNKLNIQIEFIDIGGGIGIPYKPDQTKINLIELVKLLRTQFDYNINKYNLKEPMLYTECGRYITGPYGWLISRCQSIKNTDDGTFYGLDANMAHLMRPGMYGAYHHITIPRLINTPNTNKANVVGTLCENNDWFCKNRSLPENIKKNDLFVIHDCGAHAHSMGFNYNSKLKCPELLITFSGDVKKIRNRENIDYHLYNTYMYNKNYIINNLVDCIFVICLSKYINIYIYAFLGLCVFLFM